MQYRILIYCMVVSCFLGISATDSIGAAPSQISGKEAEKTQLVSLQQLQRTLLEDVRRRVDSPLVTVGVKVLFPKKPLTVPKGKLKLKVERDRFGQLSGRRAFRVQVEVDSKMIKTASVVASVTARAEVMTPVRWIKLHEVLQPRDLMKTSVNLRTFNQDVVMHADDIIGKQATRSLPPHQPLRLSYVTIPPLVHKGDRVMIEVRRGGLFIQTPGVAKASGHSGELILVSNLTSGREVLASILAPGVVEVQF